MSDGTASITGAFSPTDPDASGSASPTASFFPSLNFVPNMITSALGPDETAIICCPSGYELHPQGTACRTTLQTTELAGSSACVAVYTGSLPIPSEDLTGSSPMPQETWVFDGQTTTQIVDILYPLPTDYRDDMQEVQFTFGADALMINNGTDGEESTGSATATSLWVVGGALLAGLVTMMAL